MDLRHDWKALNEVLFSGANPASAATGGASVVLLEDDDPVLRQEGGVPSSRVIDGVVSNGRAFTDLGIGGVSSNKELLDGLATKYGADQTIVLSKKMLDQCVIEAASLGTNYFQQLQRLREQASRAKGGPIVSRKHFLLDLFGGKLKRVLPRRFNALLFLDQRPTDAVGSAPFAYRAILMSYASGQLDQFFEPDFSSLHENRLKNWHNESDAIGQYLESRYMLPCFGIFMHKDEWQRCLETAAHKRRPWRSFVRFHDEGLAQVYPNGFIAKSLLASQRLMVYFGRV
ncbi:MAG: hypothetical protein HY075_01530 [Deltaproteobacteria bacterium]|nr:hypothetical protein [Deltaproteobacteria bacterium]